MLNGASGFLGNSLLSQLAESGENEIVAITGNVSELREQFKEYETVSVIGRNEFPAWEQLDYFVNCAFPRNNDGGQLAEGLSYLFEQIDYYSTRATKGIINISSQSVYSQKKDALAVESDSVHPDTLYALGKFAVEKYLAHRVQGVPFTSIRMASLIGPQFGQRVTNIFAKKVLNGEDITVKKGTQRFHYLDIVDAVDGLKKLLASNPKGWKPVYNLGPNRVCTIDEIAEVVIEVGKEYCQSTVHLTIENSDDSVNNTLDSSLFYTDFHWSPTMQLNDSVRNIYRYLTEG